MRTRGELDQSSVGGHDLLCCIEARGSLAAEYISFGPLVNNANNDVKFGSSALLYKYGNVLHRPPFETCYG